MEHDNGDLVFKENPNNDQKNVGKQMVGQFDEFSWQMVGQFVEFSWREEKKNIIEHFARIRLLHQNIFLLHPHLLVKIVKYTLFMTSTKNKIK